jgi:carbon starvation protein
MFEALFILTTVDAGTRVARFLLQELGSRLYKPLARTGWLPGNIAASLAVVCAWSYLIYSGNVSSIWPMFGVANQLLAAVAFGVGTMVIVKSGKLKYAWVTLVPMAFMFITTFSASWELLWIFRDKSLHAATASEALTFRIDAFLVCLMAGLAIIVLIDMIHKFYRHLSGKIEIVNSRNRR